MKERWSLRGRNKGASLIAVITAIVFVGVIGLVITNITITNIQMKEMEQQGKTNFYKAEQVMDDLAAGLNNKAAQAMQLAYTEMLSKYRTVTASGGNVQETFRRMYMDNLISVFQAATETGNEPRQKKDGLGTDAKVTYEIGYYSINTVKSCFTAPAAPAATPDPSDPAATPVPVAESPYAQCLKTVAAVGTDSASYYRADYTTGTFVLEGIIITSTEENGYTTTIRTDVAFQTPELNFDGNNMVKDFMRYSLIADHAINVNASGIQVDGNAYAGAGGIYTSLPGTGASFIGNTIVTRGDISVSSGGNLMIGSDYSKIYAENATTKTTPGSTTPSYLTLKGNIYISDDLELDGKNSVTKLEGYYYGYNFQKNYGVAGDVTDSQYSSAVVINAKNSKLDFTALKHMMLAGRTYIDRNGREANVVPLGESLSVRSNQMAYYVPEAFLDFTGTTPKFADGTGAIVSSFLKVTDITSYVNKDDPVVAYHYTTIGGGDDVVYFLKFASDTNASKFFEEYYQNNKSQVDDYVGSYLTNDSLIVVDADTIINGRGDILRRDGAGNLFLEKVTLAGSTFAENGAYFSSASMYATTYKSLQLYLESNHTGVKADNVRFGDTNDKTQDKLFERMIKKQKFKDAMATQTDKRKIIEYTDGAGNKTALVLIDNEGAGAYVVPADYKGGIIIATGDVEVFTGMAATGQEFAGMILAGGDISFATNACVKSNEALVSQMFADDARKTNMDFVHFFQDDFYPLTESNMGEVSIDRYMSYDNWTKTIE